MEKWEYKLIERNERTLEEQLGQAGEEGWEAVGLTINSESFVTTILLKRKKQK